jgi:hypothetical protein
MQSRLAASSLLVVILTLSFPGTSLSGHDETHLAIAKAAGYQKWYNAAGADIAKVKAGKVEDSNHYANSPPDTIVTPQMVFDQVSLYDQIEEHGHLYGAIVASYYRRRK